MCVLFRERVETTAKSGQSSLQPEVSAPHRGLGIPRAAPRTRAHTIHGGATHGDHASAKNMTSGC